MLNNTVDNLGDINIRIYEYFWEIIVPLWTALGVIGGPKCTFLCAAKLCVYDIFHHLSGSSIIFALLILTNITMLSTFFFSFLSLKSDAGSIMISVEFLSHMGV